MTPMRVLGIDPGFGRLGYGIVEVDGRSEKAIIFGCIKTDKNLPHEQRLQQIFVAVNELIDTHHPTHLAIEELFFNQNVNTALRVGEARGVVLLAGAERGIIISEHQPLAVKLTIAGDGRAEKQQIQKMTRLLLKLDQLPTPDDAADALAVALTAARTLWQRSLS